MKLIELFNFRKEEVLTPGGERQAVVALGGGGARGLAHLGALELIGEFGIRTERIVGVSIGSLVGALFAVDPDIYRVQAKAIELLYSPIFLERSGLLAGPAARLSERDGLPSQSGFSENWCGSWYKRLKRTVANSRRLRRALTGPSLMRDNLLRETIDHLLPDIDIADTEIPLSIVAADLHSGHRVVLERGSLREAVKASTLIPGFFPPVPWGDGMLVDIGVLDSLPTTVARAHSSQLVIGVDVGSDHTPIEECGTTIEVMMRMDEIAERMIRRQKMELADIVIRPDVGKRMWFDFSRPEQLIEEGRIAGRRDLMALGPNNYAEGVQAWPTGRWR